jgi:hypothetical protein
MASLGEAAVGEHAVYFYNLQSLFAPPHAAGVPQGTRFRDRLQTHGDFVGVPGGGSHTLEVPAAAGSFRSSREGNMVILNLVANASGLTERRQWDWVMRDVRRTDPEHVVILINENPLDFPPLVRELFHEMMRALAEQGRLVFVASATGEADGAHGPQLSLRDGVRYINLPKPDGGGAELRFFTDGGQIWWYGG